MESWPGKRSIAVVTACLSADGTPDFALTEVEVSYDEYQNGVACDLVGDRLAGAGYEEPYLHFDALEAPAFLHPAVRDYLGAGAPESASISPDQPDGPDEKKTDSVFPKSAV